jgi:hypothetical protein
MLRASFVFFCSAIFIDSFFCYYSLFEISTGKSKFFIAFNEI